MNKPEHFDTAASGSPVAGPASSSVLPSKTWKQWLTDYRWVLVIIAVDILLWVFRPAEAAPVLVNSWEYLIDMVVVLIPVVVLMGLFEAWLPKPLIGKYLGRQSGWKGIALSFAFGTAPTGPLYVAFPIARMLLQKGASPLNVVVFLNTWAAIKIPQLLVEVRFLGPTFMFLRLALTVPATILIGWLVQTAIERGESLPLAKDDAIPSPD